MREEIERVCAASDALREEVKEEQAQKHAAQQEKVALEMKMAELEEQKEGTEAHRL